MKEATVEVVTPYYELSGLLYIAKKCVLRSLAQTPPSEHGLLGDKASAEISGKEGGMNRSVIWYDWCPQRREKHGCKHRHTGRMACGNEGRS